MRLTKSKFWVYLSLLVSVTHVACRQLGLVPTTARERYSHMLAASGVSRTALGVDWERSGAEALEKPIPVPLPYKESGYFPGDRADALGLSVSVVQGQRLMIQVEKEARAPALLFLDLFSRDSTGGTRSLVSADSGIHGLDVEIERSGDFVVRLQPELLRAVRYTITIRTAPVLGMPVQGADNAAIKSRFGVDRDAGRRRHEGIDIFAPRGTPVLAATRGRITNVGENGLGGRVVWEWDEERNQSLYYAHLDVQIARSGSMVERGDTIGLVGNTGNARTTPSHLHFGIYRRGEGAIDPYGFVHRPSSRVAPITADTSMLGEWGRSVGRGGTLDRTGRDRASPLTLDPGTIMRLKGGTADRYRVTLPDGTQGFVAATRVESLKQPTRSRKVREPIALLDGPEPGALLIDTISPGRNLMILGQSGNYQLARLDSGTTGWIRTPGD